MKKRKKSGEVSREVDSAEDLVNREVCGEVNKEVQKLS